MIGIKSYGGYIPRLRLNRMSIFQGMGWFAPAIIAVAQGERSFCNWDEDSLTMAVAASRNCLAGANKSEVDAVFLASTTLPFADRLNSGILKTAMNLKDQLHAADFTSTMRAGTTALIEALSAVKSGDKRNVLVTATDKRLTKTAYFYEMWFGDGAASLLVGQGEDVIAEFLGSYTVTKDFVDHYRGKDNQWDYMWEERWVRDEGYSKIIPEAVNGLLEKTGFHIEDMNRIVFPCFFKAEHRAIGKKLGARPETVMDNLHEVCGETGAAHSLVMLVKAIEEAKPGDRILAAGFGQGCDALCFRVTEAIKNLPKRTGINGSLAHKKTTDNYFKFLQFRDLIQTERGIRAEAPTQTAMTVLYRKREMLTGLVGGKCPACGTPQFPKQDICVNPACTKVGEQEPYEFADQPAHIKTFTGDMLSVSVDPPNVYGMIEFENGGRFLADFTDCEINEVFVGQPVVMSFRRRYTDTERGFSGYFWKAMPLPVPKPKKKADQIRFDGKVAVVTGAGAGLGRTYALEMAKRGAKVVINDLGGSRDGTGASSSAADKVVEEIKALGGEAVANYDNVATPEGGENIVETALKAFGRLDILINNAGILRDKTIFKMEPETWDAVLNVHLKGAYNVTRPAVKAMMKNKYGRIVMTTSAAGLYGNFGQTNYSAAKMALVGFMNTLKAEGDRYGIKVNTIAPVAATRLTEDIFPPEMLEKLKPEFVAPMVLFMCSDKCQDSGLVVNAGMGYFNRAVIGSGPGVVVGGGSRVPTLEEIHKNFAAIDNLASFEEFPNATAAFGPMIDAFSPKKKEAASAGGGGMSVASVFAGLPKAFQAGAAAGVDVSFQFEISGAGGGDWQVIVKDGACEVLEGKHSSPTTTLRVGDADFLKMITGEVSAMSLFTGGKLKIIGDVMKSQLFEKLFTV